MGVVRDMVADRKFKKHGHGVAVDVPLEAMTRIGSYDSDYYVWQSVDYYSGFNKEVTDWLLGAGPYRLRRNLSGASETGRWGMIVFARAESAVNFKLQFL